MSSLEVILYHCFSAGVEKKCKHCQKTLFGSNAIKQHNWKYSRFKCPRCMIHICDRKKLYKHILTHLTYKRQCPKCLKQFARSDSYKEHKKSVHIVDSLTSQGSKKRSTWQCIDCNKKFKTFLAIRRHFNLFCQKRCKTHRMVCCEKCRKMFHDDQNLSKHLKLHNQNPTIACRETKKLSCTIKRSKLLFRRVILKKKYCTECLRGFVDCESFYSHVNKNTCPYFKEDGMCMLCKKVFHSLETLKAHVKTCFKETISDLVKPLAKKTQLSAGAAVDDTGGGTEKGTRAVYHCTRCRTMFPSKLIFSKHIMLFHGKTKTVQCNKCFFSCRSTRLLKKHLKKKLCPSIKNYKCYLCNQFNITRKDSSMFNSLESLVKHLRSHRHTVKKESTPSVIKPQEIETKDNRKGVLLTFSKTDAMQLIGKSCVCSINKYGTYIVTVKPMIDGYHVVALLQKSSLSCFYCKFKQFATRWSFNSFLDHFSSYHRFRDIHMMVCYHCNIAFKDRVTWSNHMQDKHQSSPSSPSIPPVNTVTESPVLVVESHQESTALSSATSPAPHDIPVYICNQCHLVHKSLQTLTRHVNAVHATDQDNASLKLALLCNIVHPNWPCCFCAKKGIRNVFQHAASHLTTTSVVLECYRCNVKVTTKAQLKNHFNYKHQGDWTIGDSHWVDKVLESCTFKLVQLIYKRQDIKKFGAELSIPGKELFFPYPSLTFKWRYKSLCSFIHVRTTGKEF